MLWTDQIFITTADLLRMDPEVTNVATSEGIVLAGDEGLIRSSLEETVNELNKIVIAFGGYLNSGDLSANHLAAVLNVGIGNSVRQKILPIQVCVSGPTPSSWNWVKQWAVFWCLKVFYRTAMARNINDRYEKRMNTYKDELIRRITPNMYAMGIPVVLQPLSAPAATFTRNPGTWDSTNVALVNGPGTLNGVAVNVAITYVDQSQTNLYVSASTPNNAESQSSELIEVTLTTGKVLEFNISSLNPPDGTQDPATILVTVIAPLQATGWNIYVGLASSNTLYLQNSEPIPITTLQQVLPGDPIFSGYQLGQGQYETRRLSITSTRQRA